MTAGQILDGFPASMPPLDLVMVRPGATPATTTGALAPLASESLQIEAHGLTLPATFTGSVVGNGQSQDWHLALSADQTFQLSRSFADGTRRASIGHWQADPANDALILRDGAEMPLAVSRKGQDEMRVFDANTGAAFDGALMLSQDVGLPALDGMTLGGMMTYMADAAIFTECLSGTSFPVATEGDDLALERAYLADQPAPGAPLYVMVEGGLALRPVMEGPDRQSLVVDKFLRTRTDTTCERQRADASLTNTYWRLDQIAGSPAPVVAGSVEPHLVLVAGDTPAYRAMMGCNRMRGGLSLDGDRLGFDPAASTMMACPAPLDELERDFGMMLSEVTSFAIEGETLILKDMAGAVRALFTAVYF